MKLYNFIISMSVPSMFAVIMIQNFLLHQNANVTAFLLIPGILLFGYFLNWVIGVKEDDEENEGEV